MRMPVINRFAKNDRALSGRRVAVLAATAAVLASGVQVLAVDTAWAASPTAAPTAATVPAAAHTGHLRAGLHMTPSLSITAGGPKVEIPVAVVNFTGAPYQEVKASVSLRGIVGAAPVGLGDDYLTIEARTPQGGWQKLALGSSSDGWTGAVTPYGETLQDGRAAHFTFRIGLSAKAASKSSHVQVSIDGDGDGQSADGVLKDMAVSPAPAPKSPSKPAPTKPAPARPAADRTPAAPAAPAAPATKAPAATPTAAPATGAPAGTPELAQTGSGPADTFLAASAAALLALGSGVLIAVRRLRPQR
ncbi:hypothetical protein ACIRS1_08235 [Kitasatospora sp. NPDC101176]|uniref:hypothetical protein n=1 Tax=Kitasatospora sp. NPDC101176 TaxID=3364099 RepID=UPI003810AFB2